MNLSLNAVAAAGPAAAIAFGTANAWSLVDARKWRLQRQQSGKLAKGNIMARSGGRLGKMFVALLIFGALIVGAIEFAHSDFVLNSKTYELVGYGEVSREQVGDETHVLKQKRMCCLPGDSAVIFVQNSSGRTIARHAAPLERCGTRTDACVQAVEAVEAKGF